MVWFAKASIFHSVNSAPSASSGSNPAWVIITVANAPDVYIRWTVIWSLIEGIRDIWFITGCIGYCIVCCSTYLKKSRPDQPWWLSGLRRQQSSNTVGSEGPRFKSRSRQFYEFDVIIDLFCRYTALCSMKVWPFNCIQNNFSSVWNRNQVKLAVGTQFNPSSDLFSPEEMSTISRPITLDAW